MQSSDAEDRKMRGKSRGKDSVQDYTCWHRTSKACWDCIVQLGRPHSMFPHPGYKAGRWHLRGARLDRASRNKALGSIPDNTTRQVKQSHPNAMAQQIGVLSIRAWPSLSFGTHVKVERTFSMRLSSDLYSPGTQELGAHCSASRGCCEGGGTPSRPGQRRASPGCGWLSVSASGFSAQFQQGSGHTAWQQAADPKCKALLAPCSRP